MVRWWIGGGEKEEFVMGPWVLLLHSHINSVSACPVMKRVLDELIIYRS